MRMHGLEQGTRMQTLNEQFFLARRREPQLSCAIYLENKESQDEAGQPHGLPRHFARLGQFAASAGAHHRFQSP
jgi:hypothetical protein